MKIIEGQVQAITAEELGRWSCIVNCSQIDLLSMNLPGYVAMFLMREHGMLVTRPRWQKFRGKDYSLQYRSQDGGRIFNNRGQIINSDELRDFDIMENDWRVMRPNA